MKVWAFFSSFAVAAALAAAQAEGSVFKAPVRLEADGRVIDQGEAWGHLGPCVEDVDGDGVRDLLVGDFSGKFVLYRNTGTDKAPVYAKGEHLKAGGVDAQTPIY